MKGDPWVEQNNRGGGGKSHKIIARKAHLSIAICRVTHSNESDLHSNGKRGAANREPAGSQRYKIAGLATGSQQVPCNAPLRPRATEERLQESVGLRAAKLLGLGLITLSGRKSTFSFAS